MDRKGEEKSPRVKTTSLGRRTGAPTTPPSGWKAIIDKMDEVFMAAKSAGIISSVVPPAPSARTLTKSLWDLQDLPLTDCFHNSLYSPGFLPNASPLDAPVYSSSPYSQPEYVFSSPTSFNSDRHIKATAPNSLQRLLTSAGADTDDVADDDSAMEARSTHVPISVITTEADDFDSGTTSRELFKLVNQIRILEERYNKSLNLTTMLHAQLLQARARVRELELPDRMARREVERLMEEHRKAKMSWRAKEKARIQDAVQSVKEELEEERKARDSLESANRRLTKELKEAYAATAKALQEVEHERREKDSLESANGRLKKELKKAHAVTARTIQEVEHERKTRQLIEKMCTELAQETGSDKAEVEEMKRRSEQAREELEDERRMLQEADSWRKESVQIKLNEASLALETKSANLDILQAELESFLAYTRSADPATFRDAQILHDILSFVRHDTSVSTFPPISSMSFNSNSSFAPSSEYMHGATIDTDSGEERNDHGHALLNYPEGIPDAD